MDRVSFLKINKIILRARRKLFQFQIQVEIITFIKKTFFHAFEPIEFFLRIFIEINFGREN